MDDTQTNERDAVLTEFDAEFINCRACGRTVPAFPKHDYLACAFPSSTD